VHSVMLCTVKMQP